MLFSGNFADSFGEDFLGLRELGIAEEFGLTSLTIPKKLLKGKGKGGFKEGASAYVIYIHRPIIEIKPCPFQLKAVRTPSPIPTPTSIYTPRFETNRRPDRSSQAVLCPTDICPYQPQSSTSQPPFSSSYHIRFSTKCRRLSDHLQPHSGRHGIPSTHYPPRRFAKSCAYQDWASGPDYEISKCCECCKEEVESKASCPTSCVEWYFYRSRTATNVRPFFFWVSDGFWRSQACRQRPAVAFQRDEKGELDVTPGGDGKCLMWAVYGGHVVILVRLFGLLTCLADDCYSNIIIRSILKDNFFCVLVAGKMIVYRFILKVCCFSLVK